MSIPLLAILCLANWRLSSMLSNESEGGPRGILFWLRYKVGVRFSEANGVYATNWVAEAMLCLWCLSVWIGIFQTLAILLLPEMVVVGLMLPFALSGASILLDGILDE